ncbi:related to ariadne-2 protein [Phialocephala subalpina]|uniref:RBR-type E3 ubiquitin transferase n=1 Tax=Phialocephala subalpina TaxID=576137 RepID=A0A1L7XKT5_9HELO|nr:related to ariadne-2 protein [Phialocephala subalpina]
MMAPVTRKRSLSDMQSPGGAMHAEYNDDDYVREVLQLDSGKTEALLDEDLLQEAEKLGITISRPSTPKSNHETHMSLSNSAITVGSHHVRTTSSSSNGSASTGMTSRFSNEQSDQSTIHNKRPSSRRNLSFSEYERYLEHHEAQDITRQIYPPPIPAEPAPSLFSVSTRKSYNSIKSTLTKRFRLRRSKSTQEDINSCICCRDDFKKSKSLQTLPCGHNYCDACLRILITQAANDESKMPPRCCTRAIPGTIIKSVLTKDEQHVFMKAVLQFSTPWESRIFCPNPACGEFIPKRKKIDPKHPFEVDCPADWELDAVLQMGEKSGWRRCYKCRNLVELTQGCSHITCRCKAQFCYICGAVWDPVVGCPNYCNGEEELERRRIEEEARIAEEEAEKAAREEAERLEAAEKVNAEKRTLESLELNALRARQINERDRFAAFERKQKWIMWTRHGQSKIDILERYDDLQMKMRERHNRTATHLEDRQVAAEMELRATLKQAERSVRIRLRHMEAYCDGLGRNGSSEAPVRIVTERDLRELGQQYNLRDDLDRLHQSKINVMRDKQAKQMEQLLVRQEEELERLSNKQAVEIEGLEEGFGTEEEAFSKAFKQRRERLRRRWAIVEEIERKKLEVEKKVKYAPMVPVEWPSLATKEDEGLEAVTE